MSGSALVGHPPKNERDYYIAKALLRQHGKPDADPSTGAIFCVPWLANPPLTVGFFYRAPLPPLERIKSFETSLASIRSKDVSLGLIH
jgi:hypothetical protein